MKDQKITRSSLLQSKAKMIADRNERFAIISEELDFLKEDLSSKMTQLSNKIKIALISD